VKALLNYLHLRLQEPRHSRILAIGLLLLCGAQLASAVQAFRSEMVHVAVESRVVGWESARAVPTGAEADKAYAELETALQRTTRWGELYELRARLTLLALNEPELPVDTLDEAVASARSDLDMAAALQPTLPRIPLAQLVIDSYMYLAGSEQYHRHALSVFKLAISSRMYLEPLLTLTVQDWARLDPATRELTLAGLEDVASVNPRWVTQLLSDSPSASEICDLRELGCELQ
jgi:hypothetical protein